MTHARPLPHARLAPPRIILLIKAEGAVKYSGKYSLYGNPPRWRLVTPHKPAPHGAPIAAHPLSAGDHAPAQHLTDEQWSQLKLPDANVNAGSFNKKLSELRGYSEAGNVTAIAGMGIGSNTYGGKIAKIANKLLGMHGSEHVVLAGQKVGTHEAVQSAPAAPHASGLPAHLAELAPKLQAGWDAKGTTVTDVTPPGYGPDTKDAAIQAAVSHLKEDVGQKGMPAGEAAEDKALVQKLEAASGPLPMPQFDEGKKTTGVKAHYEKLAQKVIDHGLAGNTSVLEGLPSPEAGKSWLGKTGNSKKLLALHAAALVHAGGGIPADPASPDTSASAPKQAESSAPIIEEGGWKFQKDGAGAWNYLSPVTRKWEPVENTDIVGKLNAPESGPKQGDTKPGADGTLVFKNGRWTKQLAHVIPGSDGGGFEVHVNVTPKNANGQYSVSLMDESGDYFPTVKFFPTETAALDHAHSLASGKPVNAPKPLDHGELNVPGKTSKIDAELDKYKADQAKAAKSDAKTASAKTKANKAEAKKLFAEYGPALLEQYGAKMGKKALSETLDQMVKWEPAKFLKLVEKFQSEQVAPAAPAKTSAASTIPWATQILPATNSNAPSHNKKVAAIKAATEAGDLAGLQAMSFGSNTYGKQQKNLASVAIAALQADAPAASAAAPAPVAAPSVVPAPQPAAAAGWSFDPNDLALDGNPSITLELPSGAAIYVAYSESDAMFEVGAHGENPQAGEQFADAAEALAHLAVITYGSGVKLPTAQEMGKLMPAAATPPVPAPAPVTAVSDVYKNTNEGHNKFWSVSVKNGVMKTVYGKLGTSGQTTSKQFENDDAAYHAAGILTAAKKAKGYGFAGLGKHEHAAGAPALPSSDTAKDGDTKQGADGMLVLKDGHWVKVDAVADVAIPDFSAIDSTVWAKRYADAATELKAAVASGGVDALKGGVVINHANGDFTVNIIGFKLNKLSANAGTAGNGPRRAAMHKFITDLKAAAGKPVKTPKAPVSAPPAPPGALPSMDDWLQTGPQGGSNPGGKFRDESGQEWYCKFPADEDTAKSEILAARLYGAAGLVGQDAKLVTKNGKVGIASKWTDVKKAGSPSALSKVDGVQSGFAVDAWLANWDVVGLEFDNMQVGSDGKAVRIDAGGSLKYRAQGEKKPFGNKVTEMETMRDASANSQAASVFGKMTKADITASVAKVLAISDVTIRSFVNQFGPGDAAEKKALAETLIARKADLAAKYPAAIPKKKAVVFDPSQISAPPSFKNWGGSGKGGPSSKEFLNEANEEAVTSIYAAAKTGKVSAIQALTAKVYDKDSGAITGAAKVLDHPSQHVKGYAQQSVNEIEQLLNPPKKFRFDGGHPLHSLNAAYPAHTGAPSDAVQKLAKFIVLGEPGVMSIADLGLPPKVTHTQSGGTLSQSTYSSVSKAAISKMPSTQRQAVKSYTGSGYKTINGSLWDGNPSGAAKSAGEALHTLGHDIMPGTVLSRKISVHGDNLKLLLNASGKILQEPAIMSTSIRPSSWSGNVQLKMHVGPGVKGLWVGNGSSPGGGALSSSPSEDEMILPPGTRLVILSVRSGGTDADGFGQGMSHVIEAVILPTI